MTVSTNQNRTKVKVLFDPADIAGASQLLIALSDTNQDDTWRLVSCTVEKNWTGTA